MDPTPHSPHAPDSDNGLTGCWTMHLLVLGVILFFPLFFAKGMSGNPDDYYYIDAAIAWLHTPDYLPEDIRQLRHPHVLTIVLFMQWLGLTNTSLIMASFVYYLLLIALMYWSILRISDWRTALWVLYALALVPIIAAYSTLVLPFLSELFFAVAALLWYLHERDRVTPSPIALFTIGVLCGLTFFIRETSGGALIVLFGGLFLFSPGMKRSLYWVMGAGFLALWMSELLYFALRTGDPFYHFHLSMRTFADALKDNTLLTSHEFTRLSPLFNFELARAWLPSGLINLHWTINPWLNLFFEEDYGVLFYLLLPAGWALFTTETNQPLKRLCIYALVLGLIWFVLSYYVFCLMQQPRYVAPLPWAAALVIGVWLARLSRQSTWQAVALAVLLAISTLVAISSKPDELYKERQLAAILASDPEPIHVLPAIAQRGSLVLKPFLDRQQLRTTPPAVGALVFGLPAQWLKPFPALNQFDWQPVRTIARQPLLITRLLDAIGLLDHLPPSIRRQLIDNAPGFPLSRLQPQPTRIKDVANP